MKIVAGGMDHMGRVAKPKTLERAPRYEYNPRNISGATQLQPGVILIITAHTASCLTPFWEEDPEKHWLYQGFHYLTWTDTYMLYSGLGEFTHNEVFQDPKT